jgi:hypothetical protein
MEGITFDDEPIMPTIPQPSLNHHENIEADVRDFLILRRKVKKKLIPLLGRLDRLGFGIPWLVSSSFRSFLLPGRTDSRQNW